MSSSLIWIKPAKLIVGVREEELGEEIEVIYLLLFL